MFFPNFHIMLENKTPLNILNGNCSTAFIKNIFFEVSSLMPRVSVAENTNIVKAQLQHLQGLPLHIYSILTTVDSSSSWSIVF